MRLWEVFCSYLLIPLSSVDANTLPVGAVVGIVLSALVILTIVIVAVAGFAIWWNKKDSGTLNLKTDVSMVCSQQTPYCILQEFVSIWSKILSKIL